MKKKEIIRNLTAIIEAQVKIIIDTVLYIFIYKFMAPEKCLVKIKKDYIFPDNVTNVKEA